MNDGLGLWLRRTRESKQLTLADAEKALRIRRRYLQALEVGDYTALPGEIQARGFLRNYARFLNLPVEEAIARYDAEIQGTPVQPRAREDAGGKNLVVDRPSVFSPPPSQEEEAANASRRIPETLVLALVGLLVFFVIVAAGSFVVLQLMDRPSAVTETPELSPTPTVTPVAENSDVISSEFIPANDNKVHIRLVASEHAWISLSADENIVFQGVAESGQTLEAAAEELLIIATGNGSAFTLYVNGTDWGALGAEGEVVRRSWSPEGEIFLEEP